MFLTKFFEYLIDANIFILLAVVTFVGIEACLLGLEYRRSYSSKIWPEKVLYHIPTAAPVGHQNGGNRYRSWIAAHPSALCED